MAKMKIYDIARSLQEKFPNLKSRDLIELLNANGFEAKSAQSSIEDAAIGFLLKYYSKQPAMSSSGADKGTKKTTAKKRSTAAVVEEKKETAPKKEEKPAKAAEKPEKVSVPAETKTKEDTLQKNAVMGTAEERKEQEKGNEKGSQKINEKSGKRESRQENRSNNENHSRNASGNARNQTRSNARHDGGRDNRHEGNLRGNSNGSRQGGYTNGRGNKPQGGDARRSAPPMDSMRSEVKQSRQQRANKDSRSAKRYGRDRKHDDYEEEFFNQTKRKKKDPNRKGAFIKPEPVQKPPEPEDGIRNIVLPEKMTIKELADIMKIPPATVIKKLFLQGNVVSMNHKITYEEAEEIALEYNCIAEKEEKVDVIAELLKEEEEDETLKEKRPPVVCVMGHVDHGKTSLLDAIREAHVTDKEAGGITQHIGAYVTEINGEKITFLDTPGHEAFTSMRMRGAQSTDIAILVVAADDGVMPQTIEAINHAKAAGVEIIVAVNKIDKPSANVERVKQELVEYGLVAEDWGGDTIFVPVSAHTKEGIDQLLEMIILTAEVLELKANPNRRARGVVIEAQLDKGRGPVATVLVQKGTLHVGDNIAAGAAYGKIRAMMNSKGQRVKGAKPSTPVEILGLHNVPDAGEIFLSTENDKEARNIADTYIKQGREKLLDDTKTKLTLDGLFSQIQAGNIKELNLIVKADVQGSVEAVKQSLLKLSNDEVAVRIIHGGVGAINESDVSLASASNAIIIGFNVRPDNTAKEIADREKVDVRLYRVIYNAIEDIEAAMKGMLDPEYEEQIIGHAEIRQTFKASGVGMIAGSYVLDGKIVRGCKVRISREGEQIFEGDLASLKRFKDDVKEVNAGYECGLVFENFNDVAVEDQIEAYIMVEVPR